MKEINFEDEEMRMIVYKSIEIYETLRKPIIKTNNRKLSIDDKKYLSLLLGILTTNNEIGNILRMLKYDYGITVIPNLRSNKECNKIYEEEFLPIFELNNINENTKVEDLMLFLLDNEFIKNLHGINKTSITCIKSIINKIKNNRKDDNVLQKKKTMI